MLCINHCTHIVAWETALGTVCFSLLSLSHLNLGNTQVLIVVATADLVPSLTLPHLNFALPRLNLALPHFNFALPHLDSANSQAHLGHLPQLFQLHFFT